MWACTGPAAMLWDQEQGHTVASRLLTATHIRDLHLQQLE